MAQVKIKLLESRATLQGCQRAGQVVSMNEAGAKRLVERFQAEYDGDAKRTAKAQKGSRFHPGGEPETKRKARSKKRKPEPSKKRKPEPSKKLATNIHLLGLGEKVTDLLTADDPDHDVPAFRTIGELAGWIASKGDLSEKTGIGRAGKKLIEGAVAEFVKKSTDEEPDDDELGDLDDEEFEEEDDDEFDDDEDDDEEE